LERFWNQLVGGGGGGDGKGRFFLGMANEKGKGKSQKQIPFGDDKNKKGNRKSRFGLPEFGKACFSSCELLS
jgi:hypothetical protein